MTLDTLSHNLHASFQDVDNATRNLQQICSYYSEGKGKNEIIPRNAVKTICQTMLTHSSCLEVVHHALQCLSLMALHAPHASTVLRLEGGIQACLKVMRAHPMSSSAMANTSTIVTKLCLSSPSNSQTILKEKGGWCALVGVIKAQFNNPAVMHSMAHLLAILTRYTKGASFVAKDSQMLTCLTQSIMCFKAAHDILGHLLKCVKNLIKHEETRPIMMRGSFWQENLLSIAKEISDKPKILKRVYRCLWLIHSDCVSQLPEPEPGWDLPPRDSQIFALPSAVECNGARAVDLFPEMHNATLPPGVPHETQLPPQSSINNTPSSCAKQVRMSPYFLPPPANAALVTEQFAQKPMSPEPFHSCGEGLASTMMMRLLRRFEEPRRLSNSVIFDTSEFNRVEGSSIMSKAGWIPAETARQGSELVIMFSFRHIQQTLQHFLLQLLSYAQESANQIPKDKAQHLRTCFERRRLLSHSTAQRCWPITALCAAYLRTRQSCSDSSRGSRVATFAGLCMCVTWSMICSCLPTSMTDRGSRQWFYFAVANAAPGAKYQFNILNFSKKTALYNSGIRPIMCPAMMAAGESQEEKTCCWRRVGDDICYFPSPLRSRPNEGSRRPLGKKTQGKKGRSKRGGETLRSGFPTVGPGLWCLSFSIQFPTSGTYYLAACYPYTHSDSKMLLGRLQLTQPSLLHRSSLCYTLAGHTCDLVTVTDFCATPEAMDAREYVVLTGRVHPGETSASWVMQGVLDFLTSNHPTAVTLRQSFIFKIVPVLNPDGVTNGNYRCNLHGVDLNRCWDKPDPGRHPTIYHSKRLMETLAATGRLALFLDLHGHSKRTDAFFYGCEPPSAPRAQVCVLQNETASLEQDVFDVDSVEGKQDISAENGESSDANLKELNPQPGKDSLQDPQIGILPDKARLRVRMLPYLLSWFDQGYSFEKCNFKVLRSKLSTGRVVVSQELGVTGSYTLEASLGGCSTTKTHFNPEDYSRLGHSLCKCIAELANINDEALLERMSKEGIGVQGGQRRASQF